VKEVTRLGLKYNLLTRYTSFVAIDTKVRNVGGKQEVVEQALPMPQGVSDYAVGGGASMGFAGRGTAKGAMPMTAERRSISADALSEPESGAKPIPPMPHVQIANVEVQGNLSNKQAKAAIEKLLGDLEATYQAELSATPGLAGKVEIEFTVQADGKAGSVKVLANELSQSIEQTVRTLAGKLGFMKSAAGAKVKVRFTFRS